MSKDSGSRWATIGWCKRALNSLQYNLLFWLFKLNIKSCAPSRTFDVHFMQLKSRRKRAFDAVALTTLNRLTQLSDCDLQGTDATTCEPLRGCWNFVSSTIHLHYVLTHAVTINFPYVGKSASNERPWKRRGYWTRDNYMNTQICKYHVVSDSPRGEYRVNEYPLRDPCRLSVSLTRILHRCCRRTILYERGVHPSRGCMLHLLWCNQNTLTHTWFSSNIFTRSFSSYLIQFKCFILDESRRSGYDYINREFD